MRDEMGLEAHVMAREEQLFAGLRVLAGKHPAVYGEPRGLGLLAALPVKAPLEAKAVVAKARERGVLFGTAGGNVIRIAPPLVITAAEIDRALAELDAIAS